MGAFISVDPQRERLKLLKAYVPPSSEKEWLSRMVGGGLKLQGRMAPVCKEGLFEIAPECNLSQDHAMTEQQYRTNPILSGDLVRPRFYTLDTDASQPWFDFLNEADVLIDRRSSGSHEFRPRGLDFVETLGVPKVRERPRLKVGSSERAKAPLDTYAMRFFSDRFKLLLCEFLPEDAAEMIKCDARDLKGNDVGPYWWMDFIRVLDAVNEARSVLTRQIDNPFSMGAEVDRILYMTLQDIHFLADVVGNNYIFRLTPGAQHLIIDGKVADRIRDAGVRGVMLTPLQPPTPEEQPLHWQFKNYPYWTEEPAA